MKISYVIPCYRSENTIRYVYNEIIEIMAKDTNYEYEIIAVNDSSPDNVLDILKTLSEEDLNFKTIDLAKNVGKHAALMAGFKYASGDYVVCLDDDGQCPMDQLWELIRPLSAGYDVSMAQYGVKKQSSFKNFGSRLNAWMMKVLLEKPDKFQFANFAAMKKFVVEEMVKYDNPYAYVNGLVLRTTNKMINVPMQERERLNGSGGYTFRKSLKLWINGFTAFSVKPLRMITLIGGIYLLGGVIGIVLGVAKFEAGVNNLLFSAVFFSLGIIMLALGLLGEYIGRMYICMNNSPQYVIREAYNLERNRDNGNEQIKEK